MSARFDFSVLDVSPERRAATPAVRFRLRVRVQGEPVEAAVLRVRVQIEPQRRGYTAGEEPLLHELFGSSDEGSLDMRPLLWYEGAVVLDRFSFATEFDVTVPCTYDTYVAAGRYVTALRDGEIPVRLLFSGTAFRAGNREVDIEDLRSDVEARVSVQAWHDAMEVRFPKQAWIRVDNVTFDALCRYRAEHALMDWESTFAHLLGVPK
jgi:hypothetical protein